MGHVPRLVVSAACSGCYSFNNLLYKEWVTNDDKDCSIIPIKLKGYREKKQSYRNKYYFVIIVYIISCFNNKEDYFIIINFHIHLQAACVLDQKSLEISGRRGKGEGVIWGFMQLTTKLHICCCFTAVRKNPIPSQPYLIHELVVSLKCHFPILSYA